MCTRLFHLVLLLMALLTRPVVAQPQPGPWTLQGGLGLSATTAEADALPDAGLGMHLAFMPRLYNIFALRAEIGLSFMSPLCFNQDAPCNEPHAGATFLATGALAAGLLSPSLSLRSGPLHVQFGLLGGRAWGTAWRGRRHCLNCVDERLALRVGFFAEPALELHVASGFGVGMGYRTYLGPSDLHGRFLVRFFSRTR